MEAQEVEVKGIGTINKADWLVVLNMDDTVLLSKLGEQNGPKLWLTIEEWEGRLTMEEATEKVQPTVKFEKEPPVKFTNFAEAAEAISKQKAEKQKKTEKKRADMSGIPIDELDKLKTSELFTLALFTQGDELVRDKLYCALGHCKNKCGGCDVGEDDVNP